MRSGRVRLSNGYLRYAGVYGFYWSMTYTDATNAYYLNFTPSNVDPTVFAYQYYGFSARCLASGAKSSKTVRSGFVHLAYDYLRHTGDYGYLWSATSGGSDFAYGLYFRPPIVYPTVLNYRYYGFPARCLASGA